MTGGPFSSKEFVLNLTGFCSINLAIDCHQLSVSSEGSNSITIHGKSHIQKLLLEGLSQYDAKLLQTDKAFITMRDSSEATLHINDTLYADIQNKAELEYSGNPNKVEIQRKNSAHVKHIE